MLLPAAFVKLVKDPPLHTLHERERSWFFTPKFSTSVEKIVSTPDTHFTIVVTYVHECVIEFLHYGVRLTFLGCISFLAYVINFISWQETCRNCAIFITVKSSVVDPDTLDTDPDPAFQVNPDTGPGFWWPKFKIKYSWKFFFCLLIKNWNLLIPWPP